MPSMSASSAVAKDLPRERIAGRYQVQQVLGRGGMAIVYRVIDSVTQSEVALKQLHLRKTNVKYADVAALFEREFHTLMQLSHPRIIEVYGYGVEEDGPYYTMELLDGGDLQQSAPLPWRQACALLFDVCSSLSLLHSRGLVHRDVSPRNVRFDREERAKLIDFGAMTAIGPCRAVVGTAPFVAPEVVYRSTLDARTDLFSVGATLYSVLTGQFAFPARNFAELPALWGAQPKPPSSFASDIPPVLDALVLSLIALDPASRPRSAAEVMQRLSAIAGIQRSESAEVSRAYLSAPLLIGRERALMRFRKRLIRSVRGRGSGVLISGRAGVGRTRMLDACALDAQILGATVLRASAAGARRRPFAVAQQLLEQLLEELPEIATASAQGLPTTIGPVLADESPVGESQELDLGGHARPRLADLSALRGELLEIQAALLAWLNAVSEHVRLVIAVDDLHRADAQSAGLLASLAQAAANRRLLVVATAEQDAPTGAQMALTLFADHSTRIELAPLKRHEVESLLRSVFGDVPHLGPISEAIHKLSAGGPRDCMALAQHLVGTGTVLYEGGSWRLPARIDEAALPRSIEEALQQRVASFGDLARRLAQCHALARVARLERADYLELAGEQDTQRVDAAIGDLVGAQVLWSDGLGYALTHGGWIAPLLAGLPPEQIQERERALAGMCERRNATTLRIVDHLLAGGEVEAALDRLAALLASVEGIDQLISSEMAIDHFAVLCERALACAEQLQRPPRERYNLQRWLTTSSVLADERLYWQSAPILVQQLKHDTGLLVWQQLDPAMPAQERLMRALQSAMDAYNAAPEAERVYRPDEAIPILTYYVGVSIAVGARTMNEELIDSLPELLEPFAPLSPLVHAIWQNALATRESTCLVQPERARERWIAAFAQLKDGTGIDPRYVNIVRSAIAFGVATLEIKMGLQSARQWIDAIDSDPLQAVSVHHVRRVLRLQQGDWEAAERSRRKAELLAAQSNSRTLFNSLSIELAAQALASDLAGVKQTWERIQQFAQSCPGWVPHCVLAEGRYERIRGDFSAAHSAFERCLGLCAPNAQSGYRNRWAWVAATAELIAVLVALDRPDEGRARGAAALADCERLEIRVGAQEIVRALALAEAACGDFVAARARLAGLIAEQRALGVAGLGLGATYEVGARIALWSGDPAAFEQYARWTAKEYRHGEGSALAVHYERLLSEARSAGITGSAQLGDFMTTSPTTGMGKRSGQVAVVVKAMRMAESGAERAVAALRLLCDAKGAKGGHLFLCTEGGLQLVASQGHSGPVDGLVAAARACLGAEVERTETTTMMLSSPPDADVLTATWSDPAGAPYRPVAIISELDGEAVYAGIALLAIGARTPDQTGVPQLIAALGQHLIDAGDVRPLRSAQ
jgi:hypothetical protein